jgi:hypothetical protein
MNLSNLSLAQVTQAVQAYNSVFGDMDRALWCLSLHCRPALLQGRSSPVVEALVWTVKSWWGVQGVRSATKSHMAQALAQLGWTPEMFEPAWNPARTPEALASGLVATLVDNTKQLGTPRREYSLASKALHWLLPWRVPVYDSFVRQSLGIPTTWDHPEAYRAIAHQVFGITRKLDGDNSAWLADVAPRSPLRGLDKVLWWLGGGNQGNAMVVRDPWQVVRQLGLPPC